MKLYKVRIQCIDYEDIIVEAESKEEAKTIALRRSHFSGKEFCEFLDIDKDDMEDWKRWNK